MIRTAFFYNLKIRLFAVIYVWHYQRVIYIRKDILWEDEFQLIHYTYNSYYFIRYFT